MADNTTLDLTALTVDLVSAFVGKHNVRSDDLPGLIASTHAALAGLGAVPQVEKQPVLPDYPPAVSVRKSLASRDHIVSMIDGKSYRSLRRHLSANGLTPDEYRARYNLKSDYPMVAPGYSEARRDVAKRLGLGRKAVAKVGEVVSEAIAAVLPPEPREQATTAPKAKRGRKPAVDKTETGS